MKKLQTVLAVTAAMILALSAAGCSGGGNSDDETGTVEFAGLGKEFSHSFDGNLNKIVNASDLESDFSALTITVYSYEYPGSDDWWVNIDYGTSWSDDKLGKDNGTWSDDKKGWSWTITDTNLIAKFKENGIFIAGNVSATAKVTVSVPANSGTQTPSDTDTSSSGDSGTENGNENSSGDNSSEATEIELDQKNMTLSATSPALLINSDIVKAYSTIKITSTMKNEGSNWMSIYSSNEWANEWRKNDDGEYCIIQINDLTKYNDTGIYIAGTDGAYSITVTAYK